MPMSPTDFGKLIAEEAEKWGKVIKFAGIKRGNDFTSFPQSRREGFRQGDALIGSRPHRTVGGLTVS
jgi:hypothetical protein